MKIAIEGMDGVGKTTIAKKLAEKYNFTYMERPLKELFETDKVDGMTNLMDMVSTIYNLDDDVLRAWFFGLGNLESFLKHKDEDLVLDRHLASNYYYNGSERSKPVFELMQEYISVPDITVVLYASNKVRRKRIYKRDKADCDLKDPKSFAEDGYKKIIDFLEETNSPYVLIDTENKTIDEVFEEVDSKVQARMKELNGNSYTRKRSDKNAL